MSVRWSYSAEGQFASNLFYWIKGGVDSEFCFESERVERPKLLGVYVSDPRIVDDDEDAGLLDQCEIETKTESCTKCKGVITRSYDNARFALFSKHLESFIGNSLLNGHMVCHRRIELLFQSHDVRGARFLAQRSIPREERQGAGGKYSSPDDLMGEHFGVYRLLLGKTWVKKGKAIRLDDTPCPNCGNRYPYICPQCKSITINCFDCMKSERLREEPIPAMESFRFALDLVNWNGDDVINTFDGLCVSGRVIELLRSSGQTCFTYGPVDCEITTIAESHAERIKSLSRDLAQLERVRPPFPPT